MKAVLKYPGAKNRLAPWICAHIPPHEVYLEPYFGSGGVFFNKIPSRIETINDLDGNVVNYFRVIRENADELARRIMLTPFSREEYDAAFSTDGDSEIERARKFAVRCWMGFGCGNLYHNGFRSSQMSRSPSTTKIWGNLPEILIDASLRLRNAQIESLPAVDLICRYDTPDVFLYVDPPYLLNTRKNYLYTHEMSEQEHEELLTLLVRHPGRVLISGYESEMYNCLLRGWRKETKRTLVENGTLRTECIWMNYEVTRDLFCEC